MADTSAVRCSDEARPALPAFGVGRLTAELTDEEGCIVHQGLFLAGQAQAAPPQNEEEA